MAREILKGNKTPSPEKLVIEHDNSATLVNGRKVSVSLNDASAEPTLSIGNGFSKPIRTIKDVLVRIAEADEVRLKVQYQGLKNRKRADKKQVVPWGVNLTCPTEDIFKN